MLARLIILTNDILITYETGRKSTLEVQDPYTVETQWLKNTVGTPLSEQPTSVKLLKSHDFIIDEWSRQHRKFSFKNIKLVLP